MPRLALPLIGSCLLTAFVALAGGDDSTDRTGLPAYRRRLLPPEQLPRELKRVEDGVLVRMSFAEFDDLVSRAARAVARKAAPRLIEAAYHASLKEEMLVGDGRWKVIHKGPTPGLLNLEPFTLALRQARFEQGDAAIAAFDGKVPALLLDKGGEQTVLLEWSARAESGPDGLQFRFAAPPCPSAVLELDVPAGRAVSLLGAGEEVLLSGPSPGPASDLRRWKIIWRGRRNIDFRIRPADAPSGDKDTPLISFVRQTTTQKLCPEGVDAVFELTLEASSRSGRELVCECDGELRPYRVVGPSVQGYRFQEGKGDAPARLIIDLREPLREGTWQISCLAPLSRKPPSANGQPIAWRSPHLRLKGGVPRGETLALWIHPDLQAESWDAGGFRLLNSAQSYDAERKVMMQHMTLLGGGLSSEGSAAKAPPRRPEARLRAFAVEYRARQLAWLRCDAAGLALTVQIGYEVSQGQLFQLPVRLPDGWAVERVETNPAGLLRGFRVPPANGPTTLLVDLMQPLTTAAERARPRSPTPRLPALTIHLRALPSRFPLGRPLPFPDAVPVGARCREGVLALDCDRQLFRLAVQTEAERAAADEEGPWGKDKPEYCYHYIGQSAAGVLRIDRRPPRLRVKCRNEVYVAAGRAAVETHLHLEVASGSTRTIDLFVPERGGEAWQWQTEPESGGRAAAAGANRVVRSERRYAAEAADGLQSLSANNPLHAAALVAARPIGEHWRLTLAQPLRVGQPLRLHAKRQLQPRQGRWHVPLPIVLDAERMDGEAALHLLDAEVVQVRTVGLREAAPAAANAALWRIFHYDRAGAALLLSAQPLAAGRPHAAAIEQARLLTALAGDGLLRHSFSFKVMNWPQRRLPLKLPPGSRPWAIAVDGRWLPRLISADPPAVDEGDWLELHLPTPGGTDRDAVNAHVFEIVYTRPFATGLLWKALSAPAPVLPLPPLAFRRLWRLPADLMPLREGKYQRLPSGREDFPARALPRFSLASDWPRLESLWENPQTEPRDELARAAEGVRIGRVGQTLRLRDAVAEIAFDRLTERHPLVVDALALQEAGIGPDASAIVKPVSAEESSPLWSEYGLRALPVRSAILLTTAAGRGAMLREPAPLSLEEAVAAAVARGQDPSGRFHSALHWLHRDHSPADSREGRRLGLVFDAAEGDDWEPTAGATEDTLLVVRREGVTLAGLASLVPLALLFWSIRRGSVRWRLAFLFLLLAGAGLALLWLPASLRPLAWWPLAVGVAGAALWYLRAIPRLSIKAKSEIRNPKSVIVSASALALVLAAAGWSGRAAAPVPVVVYLLPGPAEAPENQTALVPADFLARLKELARPAPLAVGGPKAVLLDAEYQGRLVDGQAEFVAIFSALCLTEEPTALAIPLDGVRLVGDVRLDGSLVDPLAQRAPRVGYSLRLAGRGRHKIELRFRAAVEGTTESRNVRFTTPPLVRSHLSWRIPAGASSTQALVKHGGQWTVRDDGGERLEVDLGRLPARLHLHWHPSTGAARPARVQYRAAYVWDLHLEASRLTAWLRYRILQGSVKSLEVDLPAQLVVRSAFAQPMQTATALPTRAEVHLRDWHVRTAGGQRTLHLDFPYPVAGDFQVTIELTPREPLAALAALPLPSPRGERSTGLHYLVYRTHPGLDAQLDTSQNLTYIPTDRFAPDWPADLRPDARFPSAAYTISPDSVPLLRLRMRRAPAVTRAEIDVAVQVGWQQARMELTAMLNAANKDLGVVEWDLRSPRWQITSVAGADVQSWKQTDRRLVIWLKQTTVAAKLTLSGWLPLEPRGGGRRLDLLGPLLLGSREQHARLRLSAADGLALSALAPKALQPLAAGQWRAVNGEWGLSCAVSRVPRPASRAASKPRAPRPSSQVANESGLGPLQVFLMEQSAQVVDGRRWLHETRGWLYHEAPTELTVEFAAPVRAITAAVDGVPATPLRSGPARLWLPLSGRAGVHRVCLRWMYDEPEPLDRPRLTPPRVAGAKRGPIVGTLWMPPGWELPRSENRGWITGAAREGVLALYRAEAQLHLLQQLSRPDRVKADQAMRADAERRFARACRHARYALSMGGEDDVSGPDGLPLAEWLMQLQTAHRAHSVRAANESERDGLVDLLPRTGTPLSWQARPGDEAPMPKLIPSARLATHRAWTASALWLGVLLFVWLLSLLPWPLARWRQLWPEQMALVALLGWGMMGWELLALILGLIAVCGRGLLLIAGVRSLFRKRGDPASAIVGEPGAGAC